MFYRRMLVLAAIEICGGTVEVATCQALLALFCARRQKNAYDFFLSHSGYQSLVLAQDKRRLTDLGLLENVPSFQLKQPQAYQQQLTPLDQHELLAAHAEYKNISPAPPFSSNLQAIGDKTFLSSLEKKQPSSLPEATEIPAHCLFTLGYEGLTIDAYLHLLQEQRITLLVDVRRNPLSRKYGFSKRQLMQATSLAGIEYLHLPEVGIPSALRQHLESEQDYQQLFEHYAQTLLPEQGKTLERIKSLAREKRRIVLMCFEANPLFCHRHTLTNTLQADSTFHDPVIHLTGKDLPTPEKMQERMRKDVHGNSSENDVYILL